MSRLTLKTFDKRISFIHHYVILLIIFGLLLCGRASCGENLNFNVIKGEWTRQDAGYVVHVRKIKPDGSVDAKYFNPATINVSESRVSKFKGLIQLFIKLDDRGYPGSTYTLYYYAKKDALAGFYYQAKVKKSFEVVFLRKDKE